MIGYKVKPPLGGSDNSNPRTHSVRVAGRDIPITVQCDISPQVEYKVSECSPHVAQILRRCTREGFGCKYDANAKIFRSYAELFGWLASW